MPRTIAPQRGPVRQRLGPIIQCLRAERALTLAELAAASGLSASHLSRIERGLTRPSYVVVAALADALGTDMASLRAAEKEALAIDCRLDAQLAQLGMSAAAIAELRHLSPGTRQRLLTVLTPVATRVSQDNPSGS